VYPVVHPSRFAGAPAVIETTRTYEMPNVLALPDGADVRVEFYGGYSFWLDGERCRVYVSRFEHVSFTSEDKVRQALVFLWREVEMLESPVEVKRAAARWMERRRGERPMV
jgi:hypothetical protein